MSEKSNENSFTSDYSQRRLSIEEYQGLYSNTQSKQDGIFKRGMKYLFRRSKSDVKNEGMINRSVPCYWHESS